MRNAMQMICAGDRALPPAPFAVTEGEETYLDHPVNQWIYPLVKQRSY